MDSGVLVIGRMLAEVMPPDDAPAPGEWFAAPLLLVGLVALCAVFVAVEYAVVSIRGTQIAEMSQAGKRGASQLAHLKGDLPGTLAALQIGLTLAQLLLGGLAEPAVHRVLQAAILAVPLPFAVPWTIEHVIATAVSYAAVILLTVVFGELLPRALALQHNTRLALGLAIPVRWFCRLVRPLVKLVNGVANLSSRACGLGPLKVSEHVHSADELEMLVDQSHEAGRLPAKQAEILQRVFDLSDRAVTEVMIPREKAAALHLSMTRDDLMDISLNALHTRWPVCDVPGGEIVGIVTAKHLLFVIANADMLTLSDVLMPVMHLHQKINLADALRVMQAGKGHMAVVRSHEGRQIGVVTLEDILANVVGKLPEEAVLPADA